MWTVKGHAIRQVQTCGHNPTPIDIETIENHVEGVVQCRTAIVTLLDCRQSKRDATRGPGYLLA